MNASFINEMNLFGKKRQPFLFIIDFEMDRPLIYPLEETFKNTILFSVDGFRNYDSPQNLNRRITFSKYPMEYESYRFSFDRVMNHLTYGNSFLVNLTFPTGISTNLSLEEIFFLTKAPYRLLVRNEFVVFSPEPFVRISGRKISSFPMKGTINASIPCAENILLNDPKEIAEHHTIVDLIRNDLSLVADDVKVEKFRYLDVVNAHDRKLLQVSSLISGLLPVDYHENLGDIFSKLLPAGSVSGAPKTKTLGIIRECETGLRGYYTGVFGIYDGMNLDSAVMIRYIENVSGKFFYRSGGGITAYSDPEKEYGELIDKIYLSVF
jgi:para-aminobenzoate synthetase component 1